MRFIVAIFALLVACPSPRQGAPSTEQPKATTQSPPPPNDTSHPAEDDSNVGNEKQVTPETEEPVAPRDTPREVRTRVQFVDAFARLVCNGVAPCCKAEWFGYDERDCAAHAKAYARTLVPITPSSDFDPEAANTCLTELAPIADNCMRAEGAHAAPACNKLVKSKGTLKPGDACQKTADCAAPTSGDDVYCSSERCQEVGLGGKDGDVCSSPTAAIIFECEGSLTCTHGRCAKRPGLGDACAYNECEPGTYCAQEGPQVCVTALADGESCKDWWPLAVCGASSVCNASGKCEKVRQKSESCVPTEGHCAPSLVCDPASELCSEPFVSRSGCDKSP